MAQTITIETPPNTEIVFPADGTLPKSIGGTVTISVANESGETITLDSEGTAAKLPGGTVPATISDGDTANIVKTAASLPADIDFDDGETTATITVVDSGAAAVWPSQDFPRPDYPSPTWPPPGWPPEIS